MRRVAILLLFFCSLAVAEVTDSAANGFSVEHRVSVTADPVTAWNIATGKVGQWWSSAHTISGDAANMSIDPRPLGCFCELVGEAGGIVHMTVTFSSPGSLLRMTGGLGPLGLMGVDGNMVWEFKPVDGATEISLSYAVGGYYPDGLDKVAPAVDGVLGEAMQRLARFVETGNPEPAAE